MVLERTGGAVLHIQQNDVAAVVDLDRTRSYATVNRIDDSRAAAPNFPDPMLEPSQ